MQGVRIRRWRRATAAVVACAGVLVAGCNGDSDDALPTPVTGSSTTVGPSDPTTSNGPVEPTLPAAAEGTSVEAAKAFVGYYIALLNYAANTGDTKALTSGASSACSLCSQYAELFESTYESGGFMRTRGFEITRIGLGSVDPERTFVSVVVNSHPVTYRESATGETRRSKLQTYGLSFGLKATNQGWVVDDLEET